VTTTINSSHPLFNTRDERVRIHALLKHLGSGGELREFPASASEKVALVKTANQRKLIAWHKGRNRYELTAPGWCELAPSRRYGAGSMLLGTGIGATVGAAALAVFWFASGVSHGQLVPRSAAVSPPSGAIVATAFKGALGSPAPLEPTVAAAAAVPAPAVPAPPAAPTAAPAPVPTHEAVPAAAPVPAPEPTKVAEGPTREQLAEAAKAKQAAARKARQRAAAARRRREEAARAWAASEPRTRQAEYSASYSSGYSGYSGQSSWFAYR